MEVRTYQTSDEQFYNDYAIRTDLAQEAHQVIVEKKGPPEIPGVIVRNEKTEHALICRMTIENELGASMVGKAQGNYCTIEAPALKKNERDVQKEIARLFAIEMEHFLGSAGLQSQDPILVVGLGNWNATPDSLGPKVVGDLLVTRHLLQTSPNGAHGGLRPVAALSPGVLGLTGIETGEIVFGVAGRTGAKLVVCVDALASRSVERLCSTIQISDTGINPGAGVGNQRIPINQQTLGIPVIAVGVPTVVHASTIVADAIDLLTSGKGSEDMAEMIKSSVINNQIPQEQKRQMINQVLEPYIGSLIVTPKEIDEMIQGVTDVISGGLNTAFHEGVDHTEVFQYLN